MLMSEYYFSKKIKLKSERACVKRIEPILSDVKAQLNINDEKFYNMLIAVSEAVNNAIIHGNKCSSDKNVFVEIEVKENKILIEVCDKGEGFNPDLIEDPRKPENLLKANGRGVFLIKELASSYEFIKSSSGTIVKMSFEF